MYLCIIWSSSKHKHYRNNNARKMRHKPEGDGGRELDDLGAGGFIAEGGGRFIASGEGVFSDLNCKIENEEKNKPNTAKIDFLMSKQ